MGCGSRIAPLFRQIADLAPDAKTDHTGELVRFVGRGQAADVQARLTEIGYSSAELSGAAHGTAVDLRWFSPSDLSPEEAQVLASRIVIPSSAPSKSLPRACREAVAAAVAAGGLIGADAATELGAFVQRWLARA